MFPEATLIMPHPAIANVLFLCTHNSARSILAEFAMNELGHGRFRGYSAGSHPSGKVNPFAIEYLAAHGYDVSQARSKSWDEFATPGAPQMHYIFTVCDDAANEACPYWPGRPATAHWGLPDPSRAPGGDDDKRRAFADTYEKLCARIDRFVTLPLSDLDQSALKQQLDRIGRMPGTTSQQRSD
jgi:arsenate reductase (thioredoxin)